MHSIDNNDFSSSNKERRNLLNKINSDKNNNYNNNSPKENNKNLNIKKYLFKDSDKKEIINPRNKYINNNNINNNKNDASKKLNKNNNINNNNNNIITSYRRVNRDSRQKYNENKPNLWKDINHNSKNSENKDLISTGVISSKYSNNINNNNTNNNTRNDSPYSSTSMMALKNNSKNKISDEKPIYDNSTFHNKKKNLINKYESNKENNDIDQNIPNDIIKVTSIDKLEKIPLNPAIFTNPLLANNIQQRRTSPDI